MITRDLARFGAVAGVLALDQAPGFEFFGIDDHIAQKYLLMTFLTAIFALSAARSTERYPHR